MQCYVRKRHLFKKSIEFAKAYWALKVKKDYMPMDKMEYRHAISKVQKGDIALSIGGDNYCYADNNVIQCSTIYF